MHAKQPEPGGLADFQRVGLAELAQRIEDANETPIAISTSAAVALRALLATTRKRSDEEVARIMAVVRLAACNKVSLAEVERLLKGEA